MLTASPLFGGCQSVSSYFQDRVLDFVDIWGFKLCAGKGMKIGAEFVRHFEDSLNCAQCGGTIDARGTANGLAIPTPEWWARHPAIEEVERADAQPVA